MAAFTPKIGAEQSADAEVLTLIDLSNWVGNDENYNIANWVRQVVIKDSSLSIIATVPFPGNSLTVNYAVAKDQWFKLEYSAIGTPSFAAIATIGLNRYAHNKKLKLMNCACSGGCGGYKCVNSKLMAAEPYLTGSEYAAESGNGVQFDDAIANAYAYLNS